MEPQQEDGSEGTYSIVKTPTPWCMTHKWEDNQLQRSESESHIGLPNPGLPLWEYEPLECLALKAKGAGFGKTQRAMGNRASTLKRCIENFTHSKTQQKY